MRRLIHLCPTRKQLLVWRVAIRLPATMMALIAQHNIATVLVFGGATLPQRMEDKQGANHWRTLAVYLWDAPLKL